MGIKYFFNVFSKNSLKPAITYQNATTTYGELLKLISNWKSQLQAHGIKQGSVVALTGDFSPNTIAIFFALIEISTIIVPLNYHQRKKNEKKQSISNCSLSITIDEEDEVGFIPLSPNKKHHDYYNKLIRDIHPGLVLFTSGTSGEPKAAVHDLLKLLEKYTTPKTSLRTINFLLFDHWGGLNTMFHTLANSGTVFAIKDRRPHKICSFIQENQIELLPVSPSFLNVLLLSEGFLRYDLSSLKIITYGSEPMPQWTLDRVNDIFPSVKILQTYGLIELGVLNSKSKSPNSLWVKVGGVGYKTRVVEGLLEIKADSAMLGYLNADAPFTEDGWFRTGDQVEVDGDYIKILGRQSEIINVGGEKVFPAEVESVILELENVLDVTVYGEKNPIVGNIVCAKIQIQDEESEPSLSRRIKSHCRQKLQAYKVPVRVWVDYNAQYGDRFKKQRS